VQRGDIRQVAELGRQASRVLVDVVFPPRCAGCGHRGVWVCSRCVAELPLIGDPACLRCGVPVDAVCICRELHPALEMLRSAGWYDGWLRSAITSFKYEGERARAAHLAAMTMPLLLDFGLDVELVPVPLHRSRERRRGYNQAQLLAKALGGSTGRNVEPMLLRTVATRRQVGLSAEERATNVNGAFAASAGLDLSGRRFALIDDVFTTGATLGECAATLTAAGASWVGALTIARDR
jgi:ComF family protein